MKAPLLKNPRLGFQDLVLIRRLVQLAPPLADRASQVLMLTLAGSSRRSNQIAYRWPAPVPATHGNLGVVGVEPVAARAAEVMVGDGREAGERPVRGLAGERVPPV